MASDSKPYSKINASLDAVVESRLYSDIYGEIPFAISAEIEGVTGRGVADIILDNGEIVFIMTDGKKISIGNIPSPEIPIASETVLGVIKVGENLKISEDGALSVDTSKTVAANDDKPVSGGAVYEMVGEIENVLSDV